ncbi:MAG: hypothetical protein ACLFMT_06630 [Halobacteriales archaeon]
MTEDQAATEDDELDVSLVLAAIAAVLIVASVAYVVVYATGGDGTDSHAWSEDPEAGEVAVVIRYLGDDVDSAVVSHEDIALEITDPEPGDTLVIRRDEIEWNDEVIESDFFLRSADRLEARGDDVVTSDGVLYTNESKTYSFSVDVDGEETELSTYRTRP